jgi:CubicO group peptidase (beta-lactamase class C family)
LERLLNSLIDSGFELGAQVSVYLDGKPAAEVCAGNASSKDSRKVEPDTVFPVCSTGKGILATLAHILAEKGLLDYQEPIAKYWPEFGANGKEGISVLQALSHQAGVPQVPVFRSLEEALDFDAACARVAELPPLWAPGSKMEYHSRTFGWIVGGLLAKASGKDVKSLLRDEISKPLGIEGELFFGIDEEAGRRFSAFEAQPSQQEQCTTAANTNAPPPPGSIAELRLPLMDFVNLPAVRRCSMPAVNGIMSARAIARHYAALLGEVDGARLLPQSRLDIATTRVTRPGETPLCFGHGFGLGYCLKGPASDMGALFGHGGAGGSEGMANQRLKMAVGIVKNRMDTHSAAPCHTNWLVMQTIRETLGAEGDGGFYSK